MPLSFSEASFITAMVAGVHPERGETFRSRMKQWQKSGFPDGTRVGKGVKAEYGATQVLQLVMLVKLLRVGLTPDRAQKLILAAWPRIKAGFCETVICMANVEDHLHYFLIQLDALSDLTTEGGSDHMHTFVDVFTDTEMQLVWSEDDPDATEEERRQKEFSTFVLRNRMAVSISIEIDSLLVWVFAGLEAMKISPDVFADEFADWITEFRGKDFQAQADQGHFDEDASNMSVPAHGSGVDRVEAARAVLSKLKELEDGDS